MSSSWKFGIISRMTGGLSAITAYVRLIPISDIHHPTQPGLSESVYRIHTAKGLPTNGSVDLTLPAGHMPHISVWSEDGKWVGSSGWPSLGEGPWIKNGDHFDAVVELEKARYDGEPTYALFTGKGDAVCISYITNTRGGDGARFSWIGEWGFACQMDWYYSNEKVDGVKIDYCTWIGSRLRTKAIQLHFPEWSDPMSFNDGKTGALGSALEKHYCAGNPTMRFMRTTTPNFTITPASTIPVWVSNGTYARPEPGRRIVVSDEAPPNRAPKKAEKPARGGSDGIGGLFAGQLVVTSDPAHKATELCASESSRGPDLVSKSEGMFCDMETREVLPLCAGRDGEGSDCFDASGRDPVVRRGREARMEEVTKRYSSVVYWDSEE